MTAKKIVRKIFSSTLPVLKEIDVSDFADLEGIRIDQAGNENLYFFLKDGTSAYCKMLYITR